jgi:peptide/nickel transport system permease protein
VLTFIIRRILYSIPVLFLSTYISFLFVSYAGDPTANLRANPHLSQNTLHNIIIQNHLNVSPFIRYFYWIRDVFEHGFGNSLLTSRAIWPDLHTAMWNSAQFLLIAWVLALVVGCAVGIYSAIRQYSAFDYTFTAISFLGFAMPTFLLALLLQIGATDFYNWSGIRVFYVSGLNSQISGATWSWDRLQHIALPVITIATISFAVYSRYMRASMLDVINSDYVRTARAKGVAEWRVISRHIVRNALIPLVTIAALDVGGILGGAIITETIFNIYGMGYYFNQALANSDTYQVMAYLVIVAVFIIIFNLVADVAYGVLDPRIRYD